MTPSPNEVTQLLVAWGNGDQAARDELMPLVYEELRRLAHRYMDRERRDHTPNFCSSQRSLSQINRPE
jgi:ECF sigma factor